MGGLNKTIHFDFLIKALNKKIRAECLIKEKAPNAPKAAPPEPPQLAGTSGDQGVQQRPRTLGNSRILGPHIYTLTLPEAASWQCR